VHLLVVESLNTFTILYSISAVLRCHMSPSSKDTVDDCITLPSSLVHEVDGAGIPAYRTSTLKSRPHFSFSSGLKLLRSMHGATATRMRNTLLSQPTSTYRKQYCSYDIYCTINIKASYCTVADLQTNLKLIRHIHNMKDQ